MRIAICDDEKAFLKKFRNEISEILNEADYELTEFTSGENLSQIAISTCNISQKSNNSLV